MSLTHLVGTPNIQIMNLRKVRPSEPFDFRIHRGRPLGNPYSLNDYSREVCIEKYDCYFNCVIMMSPEGKSEIMKMIEAHHQHGILRLFCWCHPEPCHGGVVRNHLISRLQNNE